MPGSSLSLNSVGSSTSEKRNAQSAASTSYATQSTTPTTTTTQSIKRGRGRPTGSKNKPKINENQSKKSITKSHPFFYEDIVEHLFNWSLWRVKHNIIGGTKIF